jgi:hypothetical protein
MADPKNQPGDFADAAGLSEADHVHNEARSLERETEAWHDTVRLGQPGHTPAYRDLLAAIETASALCQRMADDPDNTTPETRYLEGVDNRLQKICTDLREHEAEAKDNG